MTNKLHAVCWMLVAGLAWGADQEINTNIIFKANVRASTLTTGILHSDVNGNFTSSGVTVPQGGTGLTTLTANNVLLGNGTSSPTFVAPSTSGNVLTSNGTTWVSSPASGSAKFVRGISITTPSTGLQGYVICPVAGTITGVRIIADQSSSAVFDVWKVAYGSLPTVSNTITASAKPTLSSAVMSRDNTLTGWTTSVAVDDVIGFNLDSVSDCNTLTLMLVIQP